MVHGLVWATYSSQAKFARHSTHFWKYRTLGLIILNQTENVRGHLKFHWKAEEAVMSCYLAYFKEQAFISGISGLGFANAAPKKIRKRKRKQKTSNCKMCPPNSQLWGPHRSLEGLSGKQSLVERLLTKKSRDIVKSSMFLNENSIIKELLTWQDTVFVWPKELLLSLVHQCRGFLITEVK